MLSFEKKINFVTYLSRIMKEKGRKKLSFSLETENFKFYVNLKSKGSFKIEDAQIILQRYAPMKLHRNYETSYI